MNLYPHQQREVDDHGLEPFRGLLWCPRAGKSRAVVATAQCMHQFGMIDRMIIVSPNGVHENWVVQELIPAFDRGAVWQWDTSRDDQALKEDHAAVSCRSFAIYSIPSHVWTLDRAKWFLTWAKRRALGTLLVIDESDDYASPSSKRSRRARSLAQQCSAVRILTGTPWHDSILNAWSQLELLGKGRSGYATYTGFSRRYGQWETRFGPHGSWPRLAGYQNVEELMDRVKDHCSIITAADIPDMPRTVNRLINFDASPSVQADMAQLQNDIDIENAGVMFGKLQQLAGMDPHRMTMTIRLALRHRYCIIWCRYVAEIEALKERIPQAATWYGDTPESERHRVRETLRHDSPQNYPLIVIAQPQSCGRGLDFSRAEAAVFHSYVASSRLHDQALNRVLAIGTGTTPVYYICTTGIDAYIIQRLRTKTRFARITMNDIEEVQEYSLMPKEVRLRQLWRQVKGIDLRTV